ncbi:MAG TPA: glycosyltransferase family 4 protein [Thermoanaerobaculia bacterium]|nr:glycosyltransferase family 4 protein [Thermoanaerobaculia bacterium]
MRIVYLLASSVLSGGTKVVLQQAEELASRGHRVTVVCPEPPPSWFPRGRAAYEESAFGTSRALPESDVAVATFWTTVEPAVAHAAGRVFHLCQGYEASFGGYANVRDRIVAAYRLPTRKLALTPRLREVLRENGHGEAEVIGQAFDAAAFASPPRPAREPLSVLLPGIDEGDVKGVRDGLAALVDLRARGEIFRILRVSPEPVSRWERDLGATDEYHRAVAVDRMPFLYRRADVFLGPSHVEDGFDLPALEALASSLPAALSDTPAHRFSAGDAAVFFPPGDVAAIAEAVAKLLRDRPERERLAHRGPARAAAFRTSDVADRLEAIFAEAIREEREARK